MNNRDNLFNTPSNFNDNDSIQQISIDKLIAMTEQPRKVFNNEALIDLSKSIKNYGILQPIIVAPRADGKFTIIAGERRWRASKLASLKSVPCIVRELAEHTNFEVALIENIQRESLSPLEEARAFNKLLSEFHYTQENLAEKMGKERSTISNALRLLTLPPEILLNLEKHTISAGHARALCSIDEKRTQLRICEAIHKKKLSVRQTEELVKKYKKGSKEPKKLKDNLTPDLRQLCDQFKGHLGTKVSITGSIDSGKIEISYYAFEDLERLSDLILGNIID